MESAIEKRLQFFGKIQDYKAVTCLIFFEKKLLIYKQKIRNNPIEKPWNQSIYRPTFTNSVG
jgi:hypothetical protein